MSTIILKQTERAMNHLRSLKPYDGWSTDFYIGSSGDRVVMLRRRNVPLTKGPGFIAIAYDEHGTKAIVGITKIIGDTEESCFCRGTVLVEPMALFLVLHQKFGSDWIRIQKKRN